MNRMNAPRTLLLVALSSLLALSTASADVVTENELDNTAVNNSLATAQAIANASFTPNTDTTSNGIPLNTPTVRINGHGGMTDVDFYSFQAQANAKANFDIANNPTTFDTILSVFNSSGTLIAIDDDSETAAEASRLGQPLKPVQGSQNVTDSFIGTLTLPTTGTYYVAVTAFANFPGNLPSGFSTALPRTYLTRTDGLTATPADDPNGTTNVALSGAPAGVSTFLNNGPQAASAPAYNLFVSVQNPVVVPEPGSIALLGIGVVGLLGYVRRRRKA